MFYSSIVRSATAWFEYLRILQMLKEHDCPPRVAFPTVGIIVAKHCRWIRTRRNESLPRNFFSRSADSRRNPRWRTAMFGCRRFRASALKPRTIVSRDESVDRGLTGQR